jgi:nitroreductase
LPEGTAETTDIFEIMHTMRAMRRLKPDPVPDELIRKILLAGQAAANGGNTQRWRFLVLKNHPGKKVVQGYYKNCSTTSSGPAIAIARRPRDRISRSNCGKWRPTNT